MEAPQCKKCTGKLVVKENMFYWRGRYFTGLVCETCNALWDNPEDSFEDYVRETDKGSIGQDSCPGSSYG